MKLNNKSWKLLLLLLLLLLEEEEDEKFDVDSFEFFTNMDSLFEPELFEIAEEDMDVSSS